MVKKVLSTHNWRYEKLIILFTLLYFCVVYIFLFFRNDFDFLGHWITIISPKKLLILIAVSALVSMISVALLKSYKKLFLCSLLIFNIGLIPASYEDYYFDRRQDYQGNNFQLIASNNPYLNQTSSIRKIKKEAKNINDLWFQLEDYLPEYNEFPSEQKNKSIAAMLIVSAFFDFGEPSGALVGGCVGSSSETNYQKVNLSFSVYQKAIIGCCIDFANMLASFLTYLEFENDLVHMPAGHLANRVLIDGHWNYIDSNTNVVATSFLQDKKTLLDQLLYYPHSNISTRYKRQNTYNFQNALINSFFNKTHYISDADDFIFIPARKHLKEIPGLEPMI